MKTTWPILAIGDIHFPFQSQDSLDFAYSFIKEKKPKVIIQMGDLFDFYAHSRFPKRLRLTAEQEVELGHSLAKKFWAKVRKLAPKAKLYQLRGNHDARPRKRIIEAIPEILAVYQEKDLWTYKGVESVLENEIIINGIVFEHGYLSKLGDHLAKNDFMPTVRAHSHTGGVHYRRVGKGEGRVTWELDVGYLADPFSPELIYRPSKKFFKWTQGLGFIDANGPAFVPRRNQK